jgi:hypothetical protein
MERYVQYAISIGSDVMIPRPRARSGPPPNFHDRATGIETSKENRTVLEKVSPPGPSAGSGPFLMAGDWEARKSVTSPLNWLRVDSRK